MAERPIYCPEYSGDQLVTERMVTFEWIPGMAASQKRKNVVALHESAKELGLLPTLEVSTKSENRLGYELSAFNLSVLTSDDMEISLEAAYQGSKKFELGGPYRDFFTMTGREIKRDPRLHNSGELLSYSFDGLDWDLEPKTSFYDWLYLHALNRKDDVIDQLSDYKGFTDIEFNPNRSINCQARSCAMYISLHSRGILNDVLEDLSTFMEVSEKDSMHQSHSDKPVQRRLI